jgi:hypothetical protein
MAEKSLVNDEAEMAAAWAVVFVPAAVVEVVLVDEELLQAASAKVAAAAIAMTRARFSEMFMCFPFVGSVYVCRPRAAADR